MRDYVIFNDGSVAYAKKREMVRGVDCVCTDLIKCAYHAVEDSKVNR